jgi:hypothetical protein
MTEIKDNGKADLRLTKHNAMQTYGGREVQLHAFLTLSLNGNGYLHAPAHASWQKNHGNHRTEDLVDPRRAK